MTFWPQNPDTYVFVERTGFTPWGQGDICGISAPHFTDIVCARWCWFRKVKVLWIGESCLCNASKSIKKQFVQLLFLHFNIIWLCHKLCTHRKHQEKQQCMQVGFMLRNMCCSSSSKCHSLSCSIQPGSTWCIAWLSYLIVALAFRELFLNVCKIMKHAVCLSVEVEFLAEDLKVMC